MIPLSKIELNITIDKGSDGQGCFDSPEVGDVEREIRSKKWRSRQGCFDSPEVGDVESFKNLADQEQIKDVASTLSSWEILKASKFKLNGKVERSRGLKNIS